MEWVINLVSFDLKNCMFDLEQIDKESGEDVRYVGLPDCENDAAMYHFFQRAYPSDFKDTAFYEMKRYLRSDAEPSKEFYAGAGVLSYRNACYLTRTTAFQSEKTQKVLSQIEGWLEPGAQTIIDLPVRVTEGWMDSADEKVQQVREVVAQMAVRYPCTVVTSVSCMEKKVRQDTGIAEELKIPYLRWNGTRIPGASLFEQAQQDEINYQNHIIALIQKTIESAGETDDSRAL